MSIRSAGTPRGSHPRRLAERLDRLLRELRVAEVADSSCDSLCVLIAGLDEDVDVLSCTRSSEDSHRVGADDDELNVVALE